MARRRVQKRTDTSNYPDLPWVAFCYGCTWEHLAPSQPRAFGKAMRHSSCLGFRRA